MFLLVLGVGKQMWQFSRCMKSLASDSLQTMSREDMMLHVMLIPLDQ